jgi:hypothetical protein
MREHFDAGIHDAIRGHALAVHASLHRRARRKQGQGCNPLHFLIHLLLLLFSSKTALWFRALSPDGRAA